MSVELLYFNELSKICQNLKIRKAAYLGAFSILFTTYIALPFQRCRPCASSSLRRLRSASPAAAIIHRAKNLYKYFLISAN